MLEVQTAGLTHPGLRRTHNEDAYYISPDQRLLVVADGLGGEVGGAIASALAVETIENLWKTAPPDTATDDIPAWMDKAVASANGTICNVAQADTGLYGMGTTLIFAVLPTDEYLWIAYVGDSRAYLLRGGQVQLLTRDHSVVQEMVDQGKLSEEEARVSPSRHLVTRCLGYEQRAIPDIIQVDVQSGDQVMLCSDGLPMVIADEAIGAINKRTGEPTKICQELVSATLKAGAPDNVTVVVAQFLQAQ